MRIFHMHVTVDTFGYYGMHLRRPSGFGSWIFRMGTETIWFEDMLYDDALRKAKRKASALSVSRIYLLG